MKILFITIFSLVLLGCTEASYPNDPNQSNNTSGYNCLDPFPNYLNCALHIKTVLKSDSSLYILFKDRRGDKTARVNYKIVCGSYINYSSFYENYNSSYAEVFGLKVEDIMTIDFTSRCERILDEEIFKSEAEEIPFTAGCDSSKNNYLVIDAMEDCPERIWPF